MSVTTESPSTDSPAGLPEPKAPSPAARVMDFIRDYGIVLALVALFIVLSIASPVFLTSANLVNLLDQSVTIGIMACGLTLVIIAGGFDLSIASTFALAAIIAAQVTNAYGTVTGIIVGLLAGAALGGINGLLTTVGRLNPFVTTIATNMVYRGLALAISGGYIIIIAEPTFSNLARPRVIGLPMSVIIFLAFALFCMFLLNRTVFGRHLYAVGGNQEAARLAGVRAGRVRAVTYVILGVGAGLAGMISTSRTLTVDANAGTGLEFTAIAAVLLGGTSVAGGSGAIWRTLVGVFLLQLVSNGFNLMGVDPTYQRVFTGVIILVAVSWDVWMRRNTQR